MAPQVAQPLEGSNYYTPQANAVPANPQPGYASDGYYSSSQRPVYVRQAYDPPAATAYNVDGPQYSAGPRREHEVYRETSTYHRGRSKAHSVEIVAGTAGVGAAIGAIAGGGKGAAIGAISGGGAGFAYDRLTHNH
ncbi:MAG: hypothetical protein M3N54_15795 [Acidobacteriota bacterium]|nr:hypothetical protein [Acidobacteriota bacterium]